MSIVYQYTKILRMSSVAPSLQLVCLIWGVSSFVFYGLTDAAAQTKLRRDLPDRHRPY